MINFKHFKKALFHSNFSNHIFKFSSQKFTNLDIDVFRGVHLNSDELPATKALFNTMISNSLSEWTQQKITGVWLKIPNSKLFLLEAALSHSFEYHHCDKDYIMLTKWLPKDIENKIPVYCTHYVGCGGLYIYIYSFIIFITIKNSEKIFLKGIVFNEKKEMLIVRENLPSRKGWGIPGGQSNRNELIHEACVREIFEETGVKSQFIELLGIREISNFRFKSSEIYFLSYLRAINTDLHLDTDEILEAKWGKKVYYIKIVIFIKKYIGRDRRNHKKRRWMVSDYTRFN